MVFLGSFEEAYGIVKLINGFDSETTSDNTSGSDMQMGDKSLLDRFWKTLLTSLEE